MPRRDPRLADIPTSVNDEIQDRAIRHLLFLLRLQNGEARQVVEFLDTEVLPDVLDRLERRLGRIAARGFDTGPVTTRRLQELAAALNQIVDDGLRGLRGEVVDRLVALAKQEATWQVGAINSSLPVKLEMVIPSAATMRAVVTKHPFDGAPLADWFRGLARQTQRGLIGAILRGLVEGETVGQIVRRIRGTRANRFRDGVLATTRHNAEAIARTAVIHVSNIARQETLTANADVLKGVQWVATLDSRTCPECQGLDGKVFPLDKGRRPPAHVNCRCTISPVLKSFRQLGIDADEIPPATRASIDGQVPETTTYNQWLRRQSASVQDEALGPTRGALFRRGELSVSQFTNRTGRVFTLDELRGREPEAFDRANL